MKKNYDDFIRKARSVAPKTQILLSDDDRAPYGSDWTRVAADPGPVLLPSSVQEVSSLLKLCREMDQPVVPSGGRTGLAGGAVAANGEVVLNLSRMNKTYPVDALGRSVRAQAGVTTESLHEHCKSAGFFWPIDLASKGTCQIGGNLSTNAGGVRVIGYGMTRKWVLGLQAVTIDGDILELNGDLEKNNTGYDLVQLLIGSEGTLAVITEATLRLTRLPSLVSVFLFAIPSLEAMMAVFESARQGPFDILAFEFFSERCLLAVKEKLGKTTRFSKEAPFYILIEISHREETAREMDGWLGGLLENGTALDGMVAHSSEEKKEVWALREGITESLQVKSQVRKYDVAVPLRRLLSFLKEVEGLMGTNQLSIDLYLFGHLGDGSPHLNLLKPQGTSDEKFEKDCAKFETLLYPLLKSHGGSVSAEHGVGLLKKNWILFSRSAAELRLYRRIKEAFDPNNLLNPGKILALP